MLASGIPKFSFIFLDAPQQKKKKKKGFNIFTPVTSFWRTTNSIDMNSLKERGTQRPHKIPLSRNLVETDYQSNLHMHHPKVLISLLDLLCMSQEDNIKVMVPF